MNLSDITDYSPRKDQVFILLKEEDEKTSGGIILPDRSRRVSAEGEVIALGIEVSTDIHLGDHVCWPEHLEYRFVSKDRRSNFACVRDQDILMLSHPQEPTNE